MQELSHKLMRDIRSIGVKVDFDLELKHYSKTYFGRYDPNKNKVIMYVYQDEGCTRRYKYEDLLMTLIHEAVHCIQWKDKSFVRVKGIMHDSQFHAMYKTYSDRAKASLLFKEVKINDTIFNKVRFNNSAVYC